MRKLLSTLVLAISFISCENDENLKTYAIDSNIEIVPIEILTSDKVIVGLSCKTEKMFNCENHIISTIVNYNQDRVIITFTSVPELDLCYLALGPASNLIALNYIANGEYEIGLNNGTLKNNGILTITNEELNLELSTQNGIKIIRKTTKRVPQKTYWGTVEYHVDSNTIKANEFFDELKNIPGVDAFNKQIPGIYSYYEINQRGEIVSDSPSEYQFIKNFIFQFTGEDEEEFKNQIDSLSGSYDENLTISFQNYKGESISNWY